MPSLGHSRAARLRLALAERFRDDDDGDDDGWVLMCQRSEGEIKGDIPD
jgi:hypothetical protein